jgi:hypothetical protein
MNDAGILKKLLDKVDHQISLIFTVSGFVVVNIIVGIINLIGQAKLKKLDINIHRKKSSPP